jgi:hypothetical protein
VTHHGGDVGRYHSGASKPLGVRSSKVVRGEPLDANALASGE